MAHPPDAPVDYEQNVFINCPFDAKYHNIFEALVFVVFHCGLRPRCAKEADDSGEARIKKINRIIQQCRWGIHDLSRTQLNSHGLPRFNMPLELGLFLGARRFGNRHQKRKQCLILDIEHYRYQTFISDIAGQDIKSHGGTVAGAIGAARDWLATTGAGLQPMPGEPVLSERFHRFKDDLSGICAGSERTVGTLTFAELADIASKWLKQERARSVATPVPSPKTTVTNGRGEAPHGSRGS